MQTSRFFKAFSTQTISSLLCLFEISTSKKCQKVRRRHLIWRQNINVRINVEISTVCKWTLKKKWKRHWKNDFSSGTTFCTPHKHSIPKGIYSHCHFRLDIMNWYDEIHSSSSILLIFLAAYKDFFLLKYINFSNNTVGYT